MKAVARAFLIWLSLVALLEQGGCGFFFPSEKEEVDTLACTPYCVDRECGDDGCGGECGVCTDPSMCADGRCKTCYERCQAEGYQCGDLPDGTCLCGMCPAQSFCHPASWGTVCMTCAEFCAPDRCGTIGICDCGTCGLGEVCGDSFTCECGPDACGGECGVCEYGDCVDHACLCEPDCGGERCGPDGCGGLCPTRCESPEYCFERQCVGQCDLVEFGFSPDTIKVVLLEFGKGGQPGEALNVDGDPYSCSPADDCEDGLDNGASELVDQFAQFFNADAEASKWLDGDLVLLKEMVNPTFDGQPFTMRFYHGQKAFLPGTCDHQAETCPYYASTDSFDPTTCLPYNVFDNAVIDDGHLTVGGPEYSINVLFTSEQGEVMEATLHMIRAEADVISGEDGIRLTKGIAAGAVRKMAIVDAVDYISPAEAAALPVSVDLIKNLFNMFLVPDVDVDGDGVLDGVSFGVKFETIPASVVGTTPDHVWGIGFGF